MKKRICVAEDDQLILQTLSTILKQAGYETGLFSSAEAVLSRLGQAEPDLVFTDVVLNGPMTGLALAEAVALNTHRSLCCSSVAMPGSAICWMYAATAVSIRWSMRNLWPG